MASIEPQGRTPFDIAVVGLGVTGVHQLTREAEATLRRCHQVLLVDPSYGVEDHLRSLGPEVTSLLSLYEAGKSRLTTYRRMAAATVAAALEEPPVAFATYGHPWLFCYPTTLIRRAASLLGLHVEVLAGVSSIDTLMVDLGYDFSTDGLQMYDATDLLLRRRPLQDDVACVLLQITSLADPTFRPGPAPTEHFQTLQDYLLEYYPPEHPVLSVFSRTHPALRSVVRVHRLEELADALADNSQSGTLFIPPVRRRPVVDEDMLELIIAGYEATSSE